MGCAFACGCGTVWIFAFEFFACMYVVYMQVTLANSRSLRPATVIWRKWWRSSTQAKSCMPTGELRCPFALLISLVCSCRSLLPLSAHASHARLFLLLLCLIINVILQRHIVHTACTVSLSFPLLCRALSFSCFLIVLCLSINHTHTHTHTHDTLSLSLSLSLCLSASLALSLVRALFCSLAFPLASSLALALVAIPACSFTVPPSLPPSLLLSFSLSFSLFLSLSPSLTSKSCAYSLSFSRP